MALLSSEELDEQPRFMSLEEALKQPEDVVRIDLSRVENPETLLQLKEFPNLQCLSISLTDVSPLLPELDHLKTLQRVSFQACKIEAFPETLSKLPHLRSLYLGNNMLTSLPHDFGRLESLESVGLAQNSLEEIPASIKFLRKLTTLSLAYNRLVTIPEELCSLENLELLALSCNQLTSLPASIGNLRKLSSLSLRYNKLTALPATVGDLNELRYLDLQHNLFESLPECLVKIQNKGELRIEAEKRWLFMDWTYKPADKPVQRDFSSTDLHLASTDPLAHKLEKRLRKKGLAEVSSTLLAKARDAIELTSTRPDSYTRMGTSRIGGFPDLPDPSLFPRTDDLYWIFLAQINLEDIAPLNAYLPRSGLLLFFLESTESLQGKVIYFTGDPQELKTVRHAAPDAMFAPDDDYTDTPHRVKFQRYAAIPPELPEELGDEKLEDIYIFNDVAEVPDHHINGYTFTQQESPQQQAADELGGRPEEWICLLQLGSDMDVGFCFWDSGTITFCIHQEDLKREDFSNIHVSLESS